MGVTYKLKTEVVDFIVEQRKIDPLSSCRQLADAVRDKFGLKLSKSSVHDVLKESGIATPRGRKPKNKFEIPQERKKQIQNSLSKVNINLSPPNVLIGGPEIARTPKDLKAHSNPQEQAAGPAAEGKLLAMDIPVEKVEESSPVISDVEAGAGRIFLKAAMLDLGIFAPETIKNADWPYYLTYAKGAKIELDNGQVIFIDMPMPIERCIREIVDGLVNNTRPLMIAKVSDEALFKVCMEKQGPKMRIISIVDQNNHEMLILSDIVDHNRIYSINNIVYVECLEKEASERARKIFFSQDFNPNLMQDIYNLEGFELESRSEHIVTLLIDDIYEQKKALKSAADVLNNMYLRDEAGRHVKVLLEIKA